eukprot:gene30736-40026_t
MNFLLYPPSEFENVSIKVTYRILVSTSMFSSAVGMIASILLLLCLNETGSNEEGEHFLKVLDTSTFGLGCHFQFVCLVICCLTGVLGEFIDYLKESCDTDYKKVTFAENVITAAKKLFDRALDKRVDELFE